ncbi:MAG TPA: hypothetical protein VMW56_08705 [Candidatus Margulisiibacteriota bacterium]|nr:hypothetical protein [Candidatus Margulisiibacteriota bacterium]
MNECYQRRQVVVWLVAVLVGWGQAAHAGVWVAGGTNFGGVAEMFAIDPALPSTVYADFGGFGHGGLGRSTNGGARWQLMGIPPESLGPVLLDPAHPNTFYVGNAKSTDGGLTWSKGSVPLRGTPAALVMHPTDSNTLYAALYNTLFPDNSTDDGVYKTTDAGDTWVPVRSGLPSGVNLNSIRIDPTAANTLYTSASPGGVFKTTNAGASWQATNAGLVSATAFGLVIDPTNSSILYVATAGGVYKSTNGASSWQAVTSGFSPGEFAAPLAIALTDPETLYAAAIDATVSTSRVLRTTDAGEHWQPLSDGIPPTAIIVALTVDPTDSQVAYAGEIFGDVYTFVALCSQAPQTGCKRPIRAGAATVSLARGRKQSGDSASWKWNRGAVTAIAELGDPTAGTTYTLCVYDGTSKLAFWASAPGGGTCGTQACWKATKTGFKYSNSSKLPRGIRTVTLTKGDVPGKAKIALSANGVNLAPLPLPLNQSAAVTVQLVNSGGTCWEAVYSTATRNNAQAFKAKSD